MGRAFVWNGSSWSSGTQLEPPVSFAALKPLLSVSCVGSSFCMASGAFQHADVYDGSSWTSVGPVGPSFSVVTAVSCATTTDCMALTNSGGSYEWDGSSWSSEGTVPTIGGGIPDGLSCPTTSFCTEVDNGGGTAFWTEQSGWTHALASFDPSGTTTVSCTSFSFCLATGAQGAELFDSGLWAPAGDPDGTASAGALSCVSQDACPAVDGLGQAMWWGGVEMSTPLDVDGQTPLDGVSCLATGCVAVDLGGDVLALPLDQPVGEAAAAPPADPPIDYGAQVALPGQVVGYGLASGDFGTAWPGLVAPARSSSGAPELAYYAGTGYGTFAPPVYYPVPRTDASYAALMPVVADFTGTGVDDVALLLDSTNVSAQTLVAIFDAQPGGGFAAPDVVGLPAGFGAYETPGLGVAQTTPGAPPSILVTGQGNPTVLLANPGNGAFSDADVWVVPPEFSGCQGGIVPCPAIAADFAGIGQGQVEQPIDQHGLVSGLRTATGAPEHLWTYPVAGTLLTQALSSVSAVPDGQDSPLLVGVGSLPNGPSDLVVTRFWVGPLGQVAPAQQLVDPNVVPDPGSTAVGVFGPQLQPGLVVASTVSDGIVIVPVADGQLLTPEPPFGVNTTYGLVTGAAAVTSPDQPSVLAFVTSGTIVVNVPEVPASPSAVAAVGGPDQVTLSWQPPASAGAGAITGYQVLATTGSGTPTVVSGSSPLPATADSFTLPDVAPGTTETLSVQAVNAIGASVPSAAVSATATLAVATPPPAVPSAPQDLTATAGAGSVQLQWAPPSTGGGPVDGYQVLEVPSGGGPATVVSGATPLSSSTTSFAVDGLPAGTPVTFDVEAVGSQGASPPSPTVTATPTAVSPPAPGGSPTGTAPGASGGSPTPPSNGPGYRLVGSDGAVFAFGGAPYLGGVNTVPGGVGTSVVGLVPTADGGGYWLIGQDGAVFAEGDAAYDGGANTVPGGPGTAVVGSA
jgi:hypothetical protein